MLFSVVATSFGVVIGGLALGSAACDRLFSIQVDRAALAEHRAGLRRAEPWIRSLPVDRSTGIEVLFRENCEKGDSGQFTGQPVMVVIWSVTPSVGAGEQGAESIGDALVDAGWRLDGAQADVSLPRRRYVGRIGEQRHRITLDSSYDSVAADVEYLDVEPCHPGPLVG